jgi:PAS domain S-box-containing protein
MVSGIYLWANVLTHNAQLERDMAEFEAALEEYNGKNIYYNPVDVVHYVRDRQHPSGYFVSNPDLMFEPSELNKNTMKATRFSVVTLAGLDATDAINQRATVEYVMGNYVEDERGFAGFRRTAETPPGVRTTLDALMVLENLNALDDPRLDLGKIEAFILSHQNQDGGFWDEDYPKDGNSSTLKCTSFALRALGRINQHMGREFNPDFKDRVAGFVKSCFDETDGGYANKPGGESTETYGTFRGFITLWWLGGNGDAERRTFVEENMDLEKSIAYLFDNHYYPRTGAFSRYEDKSRGDESLKGTHLVVWFLKDMGQGGLLYRDRLIHYAMDQALGPGQYGEDIYSTYAAVLMLKRLDAPTEPIPPPERPAEVRLGYPESLPHIFILLGVLAAGASYYVERKTREIEESEEKYRTLFEDSRDAVYLTSRDGKVIDVNQSTLDLLGYTREELMGMNVREHYVNPHDRTRFQQEIEQKGFVRDFDVKLRKRDGTEIDCLITSSVWQDRDGGILGYQGIVRDITERKRAENEMKRKLMKYRVEEGTLYLVKEPLPVLATDIFRDLLSVGYSGLIVSRSPEAEFKKVVMKDFEYLWLAENGGEKSLPPKPEEIGLMIENLSPRTAVLFDRLDYLISKNGFKETLSFVQRLRELVYLKNHVVILALDSATLDERELRQVEKETSEVEPMHKARLPDDLLDVLRLIYDLNTKGVRPSYTDIGTEIGVSKPTARKRIRYLITNGYVREIERGNKKVVELTEKGNGLLLK